MTNPKVTVLMLVYNSAKYIRPSIESILNQSYIYFEFLIIYDESTDNTLDIINEYAKKDERIKIIKNENLKGIVGAANTGLKYAKGEYIARLDSDDIALPCRLKKQIQFMDNNNNFGLLGSKHKIIDKNNKILKTHSVFNSSPEKIPSILFFENYFVQSSVIIRKKALDEVGGYSEKIPSCEDYELWIRIAEKYKVWSLPYDLVLYRIHEDSDTSKKTGIREEMLSLIYSYMLNRFGIDYSKDELHLHYCIYNNNFKPEIIILNKIKNWLLKLYEHNKKNDIFNEHFFNEVIGKKWFDICYYCSDKLGLQILKEYWNFYISKYYKINILKYFKFLIKCIIKK